MPFNRESPIKRSKIAAKGNAAMRATGKAHSFSSDKAKEAVATRWRNQRLREQKQLEEFGNVDKQG